MDIQGNKNAVLTLVLLMSLSRFPVSAGERAASEYEVEAAFLYHFAEFVTWPPEAFASPFSPLTIGIVGEDSLATALATSTRDRKVNGRALRVLHPDAASATELTQCQMIFIGAGERRRLPEILATLQNASVLTVSMSDRFLQAGGMINLFMEDRKVRFEINDTAARKAGLKISSKLLSLARSKEGQ